MLARGRELEEMEKKMTEQHRTQYAIRIPGGFWLGHNNHWWLDSTYAMRFDFMTTALAHALLERGMEQDSFTVEPL
jgi:hypothetical protein